jgi:hypothetical protein
MLSAKALISMVRTAISTIRTIDVKLDRVKINQGIILGELHERKQSKDLRDYEYSIFSQWGEDGIIQRLINVVPVVNKTFIEFGVEAFFESNCRYLLMKDNWSGFVMDGSLDNICRLKASYFYWKYDLVAISAFITRENINDLLAMSGFSQDLGILSIDLDGNDYHILQAIQSFRPRLLICEYNAVFGPVRKISIPYEASFVRRAEQHSNLYWGASLAAVTHLAGARGYSLVGLNSANSNAFFVRRDLLNNQLSVMDPSDGFSQSQSRESRDDKGNLSYVPGDHRLKLIQGLPVINIETNTIESL